MIEKLILDACCGSRMFWFNKNHPNAIYADIRNESHNYPDKEKTRTVEITPDVVMDFRQMPYADNSFKLVVFDPPHFKTLGATSWMAKKYGRLLPTWETDIKAGFDECMRVLQPYGVLIFKWNAHEIKLSKLLQVIDTQPLFGHTTRSNGETIWMAFIKPHN